MKNSKYNQVKNIQKTKNLLNEAAMDWKQSNGCYPSIGEFIQFINDSIGESVLAINNFNINEEINENIISRFAKTLAILLEDNTSRANAYANMSDEQFESEMKKLGPENQEKARKLRGEGQARQPGKKKSTQSDSTYADQAKEKARQQASNAERERARQERGRQWQEQANQRQQSTSAKSQATGSTTNTGSSSTGSANTSNPTSNTTQAKPQSGSFAKSVGKRVAGAGIGAAIGYSVADPILNAMGYEKAEKEAKTPEDKERIEQSKETGRKMIAAFGGLVGAAPGGAAIGGAELYGQHQGKKLGKAIGLDKTPGGEFGSEVAGAYAYGKAAEKTMHGGARLAAGAKSLLTGGKPARVMSTPKTSLGSVIGFVGGQKLADTITDKDTNPWAKLGVDLGAMSAGSYVGGKVQQKAGEIATKYAAPAAEKLATKVIGQGATEAAKRVATGVGARALGAATGIGSAALTTQMGWEAGRAISDLASETETGQKAFKAIGIDVGGNDEGSKAARQGTSEMGIWDLAKETLGFGQAGRAAQQEKDLQQGEKERQERLAKIKAGIPLSQQKQQPVKQPDAEEEKPNIEVKGYTPLSAEMVKNRNPSDLEKKTSGMALGLRETLDLRPEKMLSEFRGIFKTIEKNLERELERGIEKGLERGVTTLERPAAAPLEIELGKPIGISAPTKTPPEVVPEFKPVRERPLEFPPEFELPTKTPPEVVPEVQPLTKPETKPLTKPEVEPLTRPEVEPLTKPKVEPLTRPEVEPLTKPKVEPLTRPEVEPAVKPAFKPMTIPEFKPSFKPEFQPGSPLTKPQIDPKIEPLTRPEVEPRIEPLTKPETQPKIEPLTKPKTELKVEPKIQTKPSTKPKPKAEIESKTKTEPPNKTGGGGRRKAPPIIPIRRFPSSSQENPSQPPEPKMTDVRYAALRSSVQGVLPMYENVYNPKLSLKKKTEKQKYKVVVIQDGGKKVEIFASSLRGVKRAIFGKSNYKIYDSKGTDISGYFKQMERKAKDKLRGK